MLVTYFRSSSFNSWDFCQHQYFLNYVLGLPNPPASNKAAKGNVVHKALELLAYKKLNQQNGILSFEEPETKQMFSTSELTPQESLDFGWNYYSQKESQYKWTKRDYTDCLEWMNMALNYNGGIFNPENRQVITPEKYFDFTIDKPWAKYNYILPDGSKLEGQLALKGTMDLVCHVEGQPDTIELIDWKTGQRKDWALNVVKDYKKLRDDPQLRIYHYAVSRVMPEWKHIVVTIVWIRDGGPYSLPFGPEDLEKTEKMLEKRFNRIKEEIKPKRILTDKFNQWKCKSLCHYYKNNFEGTDKSICQHMHDEVIQLGIDRVTAKYSEDKFKNYSEGGGRTSR